MVCLPISPLPRLKLLYFQLLDGFPLFTLGGRFIIDTTFAPYLWTEAFRFREPPAGQRAFDGVSPRVGERIVVFDVIVTRRVLQCERICILPTSAKRVPDSATWRREWTIALTSKQMSPQASASPKAAEIQ
jgi:hypothetical protein